MGHLFLFLFWLACIIVIGWSLLRIAIRKDCLASLYEKTALSYCVGLGAVSMQMVLLAFFGIGFSISATLVFFLPVILAAVFLSGNDKNRPRLSTASFFIKAKALLKMPLLEKFFILAISFEIAYVFFRTFIKPMESYDAIAIWALKSKIFYLANTIPANFFRDFSAFVPHIEYPLLIPLAETSLYTFLGSLNDLIVKIIFPLYYTALLLVFYSVSGSFLNRRSALFLTFLLATIPQVTDFATNGYADIPFTFYCSASFFYLYLWLRQKQRAFLVLSFILSAFAIWTKAEGLLFAIVNSAVIMICMMRDRQIDIRGILYAAMSMAMVLIYVLALQSMGLEANADFTISGSAPIERLIAGFGRIPAILYEYQIQFFGPKKWNIVWILFIAGFILGFKKVFSKDLLPATAAMLLIFSGYSFVYMLSSAPQGFGWHLSTSGSRLFIHFVPIAVFWLALLFKELKLEI